MKKSVLLLSLMFSLVFIVLISSFVSAQWYGDLRGAGNQLIQWIQDIFGPFFQILLGTSVQEYFFEKVLLLILLYVIILTVLKRINIFKRNLFVCILVSAIVSILATRYLTEVELVQTILIPYGALGISVAVFLPFLVYGFFIHESGLGTIGRRVGWILFAAVFFGLWLVKHKEMGQYNWLYLIGIAAVVIALFLDGTIHKYFEWGKYRRLEKEPITKKYMSVEEELAKLDSRYGGKDRADIPNAILDYWDELKKQEKELRKQMS